MNQPASHITVIQKQDNWVTEVAMAVKDKSNSEEMQKISQQ